VKLDRVIAVRNSKTIFRDGNKCIKVFNSRYSKSDVLAEALNHARTEETGLNIPKLIEVTVMDGKWAIVFEYIKGKTLMQLMNENPDKKNEYISLLTDLQVQVHTKTSQGLERLKDKLNKSIAESDFDATTRYDLHTRLEAMPKHNKICHGDFHPSNIIMNEDGVPYIVDWSQASQGNSAADAARTYLLFWLDGDISGAKTYLDMFCKKSNTDLSYVQEWMPIVAAAQSVSGNQKEREFLMSWVDVVDYQ